nr:tyrosine-type recombinase/integrase [Natronococcus pandeyae]
MCCIHALYSALSNNLNFEYFHIRARRSIDGNEAAETADLRGRVYPHCLRATAASYHAYQGVAPVPLQALMGWSDLATAQKYIRISGTAIADALRQAHQR